MKYLSWVWRKGFVLLIAYKMHTQRRGHICVRDQQAGYMSRYSTFAMHPRIRAVSSTALNMVCVWHPFVRAAVAVRRSLFTAFHGCVYFVLSQVQFWRSAAFCPKWTHLVWVHCLWFAVSGKVTAGPKVVILTWLSGETGAEGSQLSQWAMNESEWSPGRIYWMNSVCRSPYVSVLVDYLLNRW